MCQVPLCKNKNQEEGLATTTATFDFKEDETDCDLEFLYWASRLSKYLHGTIQVVPSQEEILRYILQELEIKKIFNIQRKH